MTSTEEELLSLDFYARKTFFKTASLMANSCKAVALLGGQPAAVAQLAHDYGRHLGLAFQARLVTGLLRAVWSGSSAPKVHRPRGCRLASLLHRQRSAILHKSWGAA